MTTLAWLAILGWTAFAVTVLLYLIFGTETDRLTQENAGLRDQLDSTESALRQWRGVAEGYHDAPGTRTSGPRARDLRWHDAAGHEVGFNDAPRVPGQRDGGAS